MKKILCVLIASITMVTGAFAGEKLSSDVQLNLGFTGVWADYEGKLDDIKMKSSNFGPNFSLNLESWNCFKIKDWFGFGFKAGASFYVGTYNQIKGSTKVNGQKESFSHSDEKNTSLGLNLVVGPAASFTFNEIIQFNCSLDFALSFFDNKVYNDKTGHSYQPGFGAGTELQVKFFPKKKFSPIAGYKVTCIVPVNIVPIENNKLKHDDKINTDAEYFITTQTIYVGGSFNF